MIRPPAFLVAVLLIAHISAGQTLTKSAEPSLPCDPKEQIAEENHRPIWLSSGEMKRRATKKFDVGRLPKNAHVNSRTSIIWCSSLIWATRACGHRSSMASVLARSRNAPGAKFRKDPGMDHDLALIQPLLQICAS